MDVKAKLYVENGEINKAKNILPQGTWGVDRYSSVLWQEGEGEKLSALAQEQLDRSPMNAATWVVVGNCFSFYKDHTSALKYFQRALIIDNQYSYAHTLLGQEYIYNEDHSKALYHFQQALSINPRLYHAWFGIGTVYYEQVNNLVRSRSS